MSVRNRSDCEQESHWKVFFLQNPSVTGRTGNPCLFTIQNQIKITIFKLMALRDTLVCDSENWCTY